MNEQRGKVSVNAGQSRGSYKVEEVVEVFGANVCLLYVTCLLTLFNHSLNIM